MLKNQIKTVILLGLMSGLLLGIGQLLGGRTGLFIGLAFALIMNFGSYWFSDKIVLAIYGAKPAPEKEYKGIHRIVEDVANLAGIPKPRVYIIKTSASNAFATGRSYKHAAVAVTSGILDLLNESELRGVIAHEISHIKNRDTLIQTIAATIAGVISYIAFMARFTAIFGGGSRDNDGGNLIELLVLAILTPIIATLIQLAISRSREYLADESAAKTLHNSNGLASALEKLDEDVKHHPLMASSTTQATAHLFIANPFRGGSFFSLFMTHPPIPMRVKRLKAM